MGSLGFFLYRRSLDGKSTEEATDHPVYSMLSGLTSPETSSGEFIEALTAHALLMGNGYALIDRNPRTGEPMWMYPLMPQNVRHDRDSNKRLVYIVRQENGPEKTYALSDIFHLRGFTLDGTKGENILNRVRHVIGLASAGQQYAGAFFANDASPGIILSRPTGAGKPLGKETVEAIKAAWVKWHQGLRRVHEPAVLQDGITATRLDPDHQKLQLIEQRTFQVVEVCRVFRMPPHKIAELTRSTNNNIEYQGIEYVTNTLFPWRRRWRDAVHRCLFTREEQLEGRLYADHNVEELLRGDFRSQTEGFRSMLEKGVYTINEVRRWLNLNPVSGGDENRVQLNTVAISEAARQLIDAIEKAKACPELA
jgi:HK97 family phage portal protein